MKFRVNFFIVEDIEIILQLYPIIKLNNSRIPTSKERNGSEEFLGAMICFRRFIHQCSSLVEPLLLLIRGKKNSRSKFSWGEYKQTIFDALKACLITSPIIRFSNFNKNFFNWNRCLYSWTGTMLSQSQGNDGISNRFLVA